MTVTIPYYAFSPKPANILVLALFAAYNGIVFYFIVALGHPFAGASPLEPTALGTLFTEDMAVLIQPGS